MIPRVLAIGFFARLGSTPLAYLLLWGASLVLSVALIVILRSRWGQSQTLHKCAVLSLLVHMLLACVLMTVRFVSGVGVGGDGSGTGPPIRVRVVQDVVDAPAIVALPADVPTEEAPPLLEPPKEVEAPPLAKVEPEVEKAVEEPPTSEPPTSAAPPEPTPQVTATTEAPPPIDTSIIAETTNTEAPAPQPSAAPLPVEPVQAKSEVPIEAASVSTPVAATPYSLRNATGRLGLVEQQGGNGQTEEAVELALRWLATAQSKDGRWDANEFGAGQEQMVLGQNRGGAGRNADTGITALALLAFMGAGHTHLDGPYRDNVHRGLDFLIRSQAADGSLFGNATLYAQMYCHSMATFALAEAQAMTGDRRLQPAVVKAVAYSLAAQSTSNGGWRYRPGDSGDTSQLGWQMMALASARRAGLNIPAQTWTRIEQFLHSVSRGNHGGLAAYRPDGPFSTSMTAEALYCRLLVAEMVGGRVEHAVVTEATTQLLSALPEAQRVNFYYWYYASLALHHRQLQDEQSAAAWTAWNDAMSSAIVSTQVTNGPNAGSWNTNTVWGGYGGRVYTTAMGAMCLEVYYRYAVPPASDRWTANRDGVEQRAR